MKIEITITNMEDLESYSKYENDTLHLNFYSLNDLVNFLESPKRISLRKEKYEEEYAFLFQKEEELNQQIENIKEQIKKETITIKNTLTHTPIPGILNKCLFIYDLSDFSLKDSLHFIKSFKAQPNELFLDKYNSIKPRRKEELLECYQKMMKASNFIKSFNLSPAEIVFMIFDMCRHRVAIDINTSDEIGRDLCEVLQRPEIVCAGYANMFACLCELSDITNEKLLYKSSRSEDDSGHVSNIVYLNDDKYNIHGMYAFDVTWNHIKSNNDSYQNKCNWSFLPIDIEKKSKIERNLEQELNSLYDFLNSRFSRLKTFMSYKAPNELINREFSLVKETITDIMTLIGSPLSAEDLTDLAKIESLIAKLKNNIIPEETLRNIFITVRDIEAKIDYSSYPNDDDSINSLVESTFSHTARQQAIRRLKALLFSEKK